MNQKPQHKTELTKPDKEESVERPWTHWHMRKFPEENTNNTATTTKLNKWNPIISKSFYKSTDTTIKIKHQLTELQNDFYQLYN